MPKVKSISYKCRVEVVVFLLLATAGVSGCSLGLAGGIGLTTDTRGEVGVMTTLHLMPMGIRASGDHNSGKEGGPHLMSTSVSGGTTFSGRAYLVTDLPALGMSVDSMNRDIGFLASAHPRFVMVPGEDELFAMGGALHGAVLPYIKKTRVPATETRPNWPDGWLTHRVGPHFQGAVLHDERGWYAHFYLGALYSYMAYFTIGL